MTFHHLYDFPSFFLMFFHEQLFSIFSRPNRTRECACECAYAREHARECAYPRERTRECAYAREHARECAPIPVSVPVSVPAPMSVPMRVFSCCFFINPFMLFNSRQSKWAGLI
jgi:hypothetical protein